MGKGREKVNVLGNTNVTWMGSLGPIRGVFQSTNCQNKNSVDSHCVRVQGPQSTPIEVPVNKTDGVSTYLNELTDIGTRSQRRIITIVVNNSN